MLTNGVLWDLDGTLADTGDLHYQAWRATLSTYGIAYTEAQLRATFGMNNLSILHRLIGPHVTAAQVTEIGDAKEARFRTLAHGRVPWVPGAREWVMRLHARGVPQAIASSAPPANIETMVDELALRPYFAVLLSGAHLPGKPAPDVFLRAAEQLGADPARCVVFEDAVHGVQGAKRAGMACVAVATTNAPEPLYAAGADWVVPDWHALTPDELSRWLIE